MAGDLYPSRAAGHENISFPYAMNTRMNNHFSLENSGGKGVMISNFYQSPYLQSSSAVAFCHSAEDLKSLTDLWIYMKVINLDKKQNTVQQF